MRTFKRLFGKQKSSTVASMTDGEAMKIINAYGGAIMDRKTAYGELSALPYSKNRIKEAIIHGMKEGDDAKFREKLRAGYLALAEWQVGFGERPGAGEFTAAELADPSKAMARVLAAGEDFAKVPAEVAAEAARLEAELVSLGL